MMRQSSVAVAAICSILHARLRLIQITVTLALCLTASDATQFAPPVTNIHAIQHHGQTFITWTDAASGAAGENYRYDLYRSTTGPITDLSGARLVQEGIYNHSAQLIGPKPFSQAIRQDATLPMSRIQDSSAALLTWSGLAVYTNRETAFAYYAVITRDITKSQRPSPLSASNSLTVAVAESPASIIPVLQVPSADPSRKPSCCSISGKPNLALWLRLHGSGGRAAASGDLQAYWGDSTMGYQDGIQSMFAVYEDHSGNEIAPGGVRQLIMTPQDAVWSIDGNSGSETYWYGYKVIPRFAKDRHPHVYPFTQAKLSFIVPWAVRHYSADSNRLYGISESMGGYGHAQWALRHGDIFAAIFMRVPILGPWLRIPSLMDLTPKGRPKIVPTTNDTLPDGTLYNNDSDIAAWVAKDCSRTLPYVSWSSGRNDITLANHRMWSYAVKMADTLRTCHYGFSFIWSNGRHEPATAALENTLLERYQTVFARNLSYPAFTHFSLDGDYGNGDYTNGSPSGCINCGWQWKVITDSAASWSASFTNTQVTKQSTADVTPRNTQSFKVSPGKSVKWSSSTGQNGTAVADSYGLVTVRGVELLPGSETTLTIE
jgi:hypothetical protein